MPMRENLIKTILLLLLCILGPVVWFISLQIPKYENEKQNVGMYELLTRGPGKLEYSVSVGKRYSRTIAFVSWTFSHTGGQRLHCDYSCGVPKVFSDS